MCDSGRKFPATDRATLLPSWGAPRRGRRPRGRVGHCNLVSRQHRRARPRSRHRGRCRYRQDRRVPGGRRRRRNPRLHRAALRRRRDRGTPVVHRPDRPHRGRRRRIRRVAATGAARGARPGLVAPARRCRQHTRPDGGRHSPPFAACQRRRPRTRADRGRRRRLARRFHAQFAGVRRPPDRRSADRAAHDAADAGRGLRSAEARPCARVRSIPSDQPRSIADRPRRADRRGTIRGPVRAAGTAPDRRRIWRQPAVRPRHRQVARPIDAPRSGGAASRSRQPARLGRQPHSLAFRAGADVVARRRSVVSPDGRAGRTSVVRSGTRRGGGDASRPHRTRPCRVRPSALRVGRVPRCSDESTAGDASSARRTRHRRRGAGEAPGARCHGAGRSDRRRSHRGRSERSGARGVGLRRRTDGAGASLDARG